MTAKGLNELRDEAFQNSVAHGFHESPKSFGDDIALMHSELSEALEDFRGGHAPAEVWFVMKDGSKMNLFDASGLAEIGKPCGVPSEMADVIIRVLDFCGKYGIDIEKVVEQKMLFNQSRPYKHGGKAL